MRVAHCLLHFAGCWHGLWCAMAWTGCLLPSCFCILRLRSSFCSVHPFCQTVKGWWYSLPASITRLVCFLSGSCTRRNSNCWVFQSLWSTIFSSWSQIFLHKDLLLCICLCTCACWHHRHFFNCFLFDMASSINSQHRRLNIWIQTMKSTNNRMCWLREQQKRGGIKESYGISGVVLKSGVCHNSSQFSLQLQFVNCELILTICCNWINYVQPHAPLFAALAWFHLQCSSVHEFLKKSCILGWNTSKKCVSWVPFWQFEQNRNSVGFTQSDADSLEWSATKMNLG